MVSVIKLHFSEIVGLGTEPHFFLIIPQPQQLNKVNNHP